MHHFLIYTNFHKDTNYETSRKIREYMIAKGQKCSILSQNIVDCQDEDQIPEGFVKEIPDDTYCMIVLGGDGTVLQAARDVKNKKIPMVGVNLGTLGYLAEVEPCNLEKSLDLLIEGEFDTESRMMIRGQILNHDNEAVYEDYALNDIVVSRSGTLQIIKINIYVNGQFLKEYFADGVIITTPTGSTGYNLSAGGPIVKPGARVLMMTPVSPHSLINRSIIFSTEDVIEVEIPTGRDGNDQEVNVHFDGSHRKSVHSGQRVRICVADRTTEIISLSKKSFLEVLHRKMKETDER